MGRAATGESGRRVTQAGSSTSGTVEGSDEPRFTVLVDLSVFLLPNTTGTCHHRQLADLRPLIPNRYALVASVNENASRQTEQSSGCRHLNQCKKGRQNHHAIHNHKGH